MANETPSDNPDPDQLDMTLLDSAGGISGRRSTGPIPDDVVREIIARNARNLDRRNRNRKKGK